MLRREGVQIQRAGGPNIGGFIGENSNMAGSLHGRAAVITGSTSGIGLGFARALAAEGCAIMLNGFGDAAAIEEIRAGLAAEFSVPVFHNDADMREPDAIVAMIAETDDKLGKVDILINNAGIQHRQAVESFPVDKWNEMLAVNLSAPFHAIRAVLPQMKARNWGRIINTASTNALVGTPELVCYTATKHGILGMTKVVALETADTDVTVNTICPSYIKTPLVDQQIKDQSAAHGISEDEVIERIMLKPMPKKAFISIEEVAGTIEFLMSPAARNITGQAIVMDGGWTAQ